MTVLLLLASSALSSANFASSADFAPKSNATATAAPKPHVLFILADDLGRAELGFQREVKTKEVLTPNIDQLLTTRSASRVRRVRLSSSKEGPPLE